VEGQIASPAKRARGKSAHLMCGNLLWGVVGAAASAYFSYFSYSHFSTGHYPWPQNWWTVLTYVVWLVVIAGLLSETLCWRERIFFGLVLIIFLLGFGFSAWSGASENAVRQLRMASTVLWSLAAVASLTTTFNSTSKTKSVQPNSSGRTQ
jgi:hypothetical protein